jgi:hypothetical protein
MKLADNNDVDARWSVSRQDAGLAKTVSHVAAVEVVIPVCHEVQTPHKLFFASSTEPPSQIGLHARSLATLPASQAQDMVKVSDPLTMTLAEKMQRRKLRNTNTLLHDTSPVCHK